MEIMLGGDELLDAREDVLECPVRAENLSQTKQVVRRRLANRVHGILQPLKTEGVE